MKQKTLLIVSLLLNVILLGVFAYKIYNNWFERTVLKTHFREGLFRYFPVQEGEIYFVGDSHTEAFELAELFNRTGLRNRGIWGDNTSGVLNRIDEVIGAKPAKIFLMIGVNDAISGVSESEIAANVEAIIRKVVLGSPNTKMFLESILPTDENKTHSDRGPIEEIKKVNKIYADLCVKYHIKFINLFPYFLEGEGLKKEYQHDKVHLNGKGYMKLKELIAPYLNGR